MCLRQTGRCDSIFHTDTAQSAQVLALQRAFTQRERKIPDSIPDAIRIRNVEIHHNDKIPNFRWTDLLVSRMTLDTLEHRYVAEVDRMLKRLVRFVTGFAFTV
jgi:hypothetical protein